MDKIEEILAKEYYEENTLECIPLSLYPYWIPEFDKIQIIEGVHLRKIEEGEVAKIQEAFQHNDLPNRCHLTHLICINRPEYLRAVKERILASGSELPEFIRIEKHAIVKQALLSIFLVYPISFTVDAGGSIKIKRAEEEVLYKRCSWSKGWFYEVSYKNESALVSCGLREETFDINGVENIARMLDPYFRSGVWWQDRMAAALAHFLDAVLSNSTTLTFLGLTSALEALLNSSKNEVTHQICERVAILCGNTKEDRIAVYKRIKTLYNTRSTLVHGQAHKMKGVVTSNSLLVSPKFSVVPIDEMKDLIKFVILTTREALKNEDLVRIYGSSRDVGTVSKRISEYFIRELF